MAKRYGRKSSKRVRAGKKAWRTRMMRRRGGGKRTGHRGGSRAARVRAGKKAWRAFVRRHGGSVKRAKAALKRQFGGRRR